MTDKTTKRILNAADLFFRQILEDDETTRTFRTEEVTEKEREQDLYTLETVAYEVRDALMRSDHNWIANIAEAVIEEQNLEEIGEDPNAYTLLCRELLKAVSRAVSVQINRHNGIYEGDDVIAPLEGFLPDRVKALQRLKYPDGARTAAVWSAIRTKLVQMIVNGEVPEEKKKGWRRDVATALLDWYFESEYQGVGFNEQNESAAETIYSHRTIKPILDALEPI